MGSGRRGHSAPLGSAPLRQPERVRRDRWVQSSLAGGTQDGAGGKRRVLSLWLEAVIVGTVLCLIATLAYGDYVVRGGFVTDSWVLLSWYEFAPNHGPLALAGQFLQNAGGEAARSLDYVRKGLQFSLFGSNMGLWLAWQVAMCVAASASVIVLLRKLGVGPAHAAAIGVLILLFPAVGAMRLWAALGSPAAITLATLGFVVALIAFERNGARKVVLHCLSLALFIASVLLYEVALPVLLASGLVYRLRVPWRVALPRWAIDVSILCVVAAPLQVTNSARGSQELAGMLEHAGTMADQALTLFATIIVPVGAPRWLTLGLLALIPTAAIAFVSRWPVSAAAPSLRTWLWVSAAGLCVVALGYASFIPAGGYYEPLAPGLADRVNAVPSIGFVLILYALAMLAALLVFHRLSKRDVLSGSAALLACGAVAVGWLQDLSGQKEAFIQAYREAERVAGSVQAAVPKPVPNSTIWTFGQPMAIAPGVPVFDQWGNMAARLKVAYGTPMLNGLVGAPGTRFECGPTEIVPHGPLYDGSQSLAGRYNTSYYGQTYFVDTTTGRANRIRTPQQCRKAARSFPRSPYLPEEANFRAPTGLSSATRYRLSSDGSALIGPGGRRVRVRPGEVIGYLDNVGRGTRPIAIGGWAMSPGLTAPAEKVVGIVSGRGVAQATRGVQRQDVAIELDTPAALNSGFILALDRLALLCAPGSKLSVFAIAGRVASPLPAIASARRLREAACGSTRPIASTSVAKPAAAR